MSSMSHLGIHTIWVLGEVRGATVWALVRAVKLAISMTRIHNNHGKCLHSTPCKSLTSSRPHSTPQRYVTHCETDTAFFLHLFILTKSVELVCKALQTLQRNKLIIRLNLGNINISSFCYFNTNPVINAMEFVCIVWTVCVVHSNVIIIQYVKGLCNK